MNNKDLDGFGPACPNCGGHTNKVKETRMHKGRTARSRHCRLCEHRYYTVELVVTKLQGVITILEHLENVEL